MDDTTTTTPTARRGRRWPLVLTMVGVIVGIAIGSATTSAVWAFHTFPDVPTSSPFHADVAWAAEHNIVNGHPDGLFHPNDAVSRQAATAFLHRYNSQFHVVFHAQSFTGATEVNNAAVCPAGERALAGGGNTDAFNMFLTDITPSGDHASVRWETDNNATASGNSNAWALCAPAT
jgi:hypothetical protein